MSTSAESTSSASPAPAKKRSLGKRLLGGFVVLIAALALVVAAQPAHFRIARQIKIAAPPEKVFPHVSDFRKGDAWSPWAKLDPSMKQTYTGAESGVGAKHSWNGNDQVGAGSQEIVEAIPGERVRTKVTFERPMVAENEALFELQPDGEGTLVTWSMSGNNNFVGKAFALVVDCDALVGKDFEKGLASLKTIVESEQP